jgi:hypothetical protein
LLNYRLASPERTIRGYPIMQPTDSLSRRSFLGASAAAVGALAVPFARADRGGKKLVMLAGHPSHGPRKK